MEISKEERKLIDELGEALLSGRKTSAKKARRRQVDNQPWNNLVVLVHDDKIAYKPFSKKLSSEVKPLARMSREASFAKRFAEMSDRVEITDFLGELSKGDGIMIHLGDREDFEDDFYEEAEDGVAIELDLMLLEHHADVAYLKNMTSEPVYVFTPFVGITERVMPCDVLCINTKKPSVFISEASAKAKALLAETEWCLE